MLANLILWRYNVCGLRDSILDERLRHALNRRFVVIPNRPEL